jgi:hypothetical protein
MRYITLLPLLVVLLPGCKPQVPVYATDKNLGDERQPLMPTGMYFVYDDELTQGRVGEPDLSHLTVPQDLGEGGLPETAQQAIRDTLTDAIGVVADGDWDSLPDYFVEDQAEEIGKFIPIVKPLIAKLEELEGATDQKAAAAAAAASGMPTDPKAIMEMIKPLVADAEITASDLTHASMKLALPMPGMAGAAIDLPFVNTDAEWYVAIPNFPEPPVLEAIRSGIQQGLPALLAKIDELVAQGKEQPLSPMQIQMGLLPALMPIQQSIMQAVQQIAAGANEGDDGEPEEADAGADADEDEDEQGEPEPDDEGADDEAGDDAADDDDP